MTEAKRANLLMVLCFFVYSISYIGKYSYSTNIQNVITEFQVSKAYAGYVTSAFFFCYGAGQLINGILCERMDSKWTISLALCISAVLTFLMFFLKNVFVMATLWGINGLVLSVLWCHCIKLLATVKDPKYMAKSVTVLSLTLPAGIVSAYVCSALFTYFNFWRLNYLFASAMLLAIGLIFLFTMLRIEKTTVAEEPVTVEEKKKVDGTGTMFRVFGFAVVPIFFISVCTGLIRDGSSTWMPVLLTEIFEMPDFFSILLTLGLPLMGVFSAFLSTRLIKRTKNALVSCLLSGGLALVVTVVLAFAFDVHVALLVFLFMVLSIAAYVMGNTLTSVLPLYYKDRLKSGQTAGIVDAVIYLGSALSTLFLGDLVDGLGWSAFMVFLLVCAVVVTVMSAAGIFLLKKKDEKNLGEIKDD